MKYLLLLGFLLVGCNASNKVLQKDIAINHVVIMELHDTDMADDLITSADKLLSTIPVVQAYSCGAMLNLKLWPAVTDFTVGLYVGFKNANDAALYAEHPQHLQFVNDWWGEGLIKSTRLVDFDGK